MCKPQLEALRFMITTQKPLGCMHYFMDNVSTDQGFLNSCSTVVCDRIAQLFKDAATNLSSKRPPGLPDFSGVSLGNGLQGYPAYEAGRSTPTQFFLASASASPSGTLTRVTWLYFDDLPKGVVCASFDDEAGTSVAMFFP